MKIEIPSIEKQQRALIVDGNRVAIEILKKNEKAPTLSPMSGIVESDYSKKHLLLEHQGWEAPEADLVAAYFRHFQENFVVYNTDEKLAGLLGVSSDRRVREFKSGARKVPFGVWRRFLVMTGRAPQHVIEVLGIAPIGH